MSRLPLAACLLVLLIIASTLPEAPLASPALDRDGRLLSGTAACNGHGELYAANAALGLYSCVCSQCYDSRTNCSALLKDCAVKTRVAESTLFTPWFQQHGADGQLDIDIGPEFYPGYLKTPRLVPPHSEPDDPSFDAITRALNASIRDLHRVVGNARDDDKYLVIGDGGVQLIDASLWALTQGDNVNKSMHVFAQPPFYPHFQFASDLNPLTNWSSNPQAEGIDVAHLIEVLTTPNNPDGRRLTPRFPQAAQVTDLVYSWPHYVPADDTASPADADLMIFSFSKLTGYASSRIGWALVRDAKVAGLMSQYMFLQSTAPAVEAQVRAVHMLRAITAARRADRNSEDDFFAFARERLAARWKVLRDVFAKSHRFTLAGEDGVLYMWLACNDPRDAQNCAKAFGDVGITTETGVTYGSDTKHVRVCMGHDDSTFALLLQRLRTLVGAEAADAGDALSAPSTVSGPPSAKDLHRAQTRIPRPQYRGESPSSMARTLNAALAQYAALGLSTDRCERFTFSQLHRLQDELARVRHASLQDVYTANHDSRAFAFGAPGLSKERNDALEMAAAKAHPEARDLVRDGLCHRLVMQYVHHLTQAQREALPPLTLPKLPSARRAPGAAEAALYSGARGEADRQRQAAAVLSEAEVSGAGMGTLRAVAHARSVFQNATKCITCHIVSGSLTAAQEMEAEALRAGVAAHAQEPAPTVPLWPEEFDVAFGLTTGAGAQNVSSHLYFSSIVPGMNISHSNCSGLNGFLPQLPYLDGPCSLIFHGNGLWLVWGEDEDTMASDKDRCCNVVTDDLMANLGRNETDGFDFAGFKSVSMLNGSMVNAEVWTDSARLQPPAGITIYISPVTGEDVHYKDGGAFQLEWSLAERQVRSQDSVSFQLPANKGCDKPCRPKAVEQRDKLRPVLTHLISKLGRRT